MLPLFLTSVLGAPVAVVGLIEGVAEGTAAVVKAVAGRLSDVRARRPFVAAGYGLASVCKLLIAFATSWPLVLVARFGDRFGKGVRTAPRDAIIADSAAADQRGAAFGFHRAVDTAGAVVGPLVGLGLYEALGHRLRPLFVIAFLPAAASVGLVFLVRERRRDPVPGSGAPHTRPARPPLPAPYWRVLAFLTLFGLVNFSDALLILRARELGLGVAGIVVVYTLYNVTYAALSYPAGRISDRVPRRRVFAAGLGVFAVAYVGLGLAPGPAWCWVLFPVYGAYTALTEGVGKAWIVDLAPAAAVGTGLGLFQGVGGGATFLAGVWAGLAWGGDGRLPLVVSGAVVAVLTAVLALAGRRIEAG